MVDRSRQHWIAAALLPALGLCLSCASNVPDGELPCDGMAASASNCPASVPVCEQRAEDDAAFCYRDAQAGVARRRNTPQPRPYMPASRSYRLIDQSVARTDGPSLTAER